MNTSDTTNTCANCGKEGSGVTNTCNKCKSVMYCNAACKKKHRTKHKKYCEEHVKRAAEREAELYDEKLFTQPQQEEDCPICMVQLPSLESVKVYMACCGKVICTGCVHAFQSRAIKAKRIKEENICPFCRTPPPESDEEMIKRYEKRVELNDVRAILNLGSFYSLGSDGLAQNYAKALELWHQASELGNAIAYLGIGDVYYCGRGVRVDKKKAMHYYELAAMGGEVMARHNLGIMEEEAGNMDRALNHWMIAVKDGNSGSLENIKRLYGYGHVTKDDYANALKSYQAYLAEVKSDQRDEAGAGY